MSFSQIMEETNTQIAWPSKLKIGAKSKKGKTNKRTRCLSENMFYYSKNTTRAIYKRVLTSTYLEAELC